MTESSDIHQMSSNNHNKLSPIALLGNSYTATIIIGKPQMIMLSSFLYDMYLISKFKTKYKSWLTTDKVY